MEMDTRSKLEASIAIKEKVLRWKPWDYLAIVLGFSVGAGSAFIPPLFIPGIVIAICGLIMLGIDVALEAELPTLKRQLEELEVQSVSSGFDRSQTAPTVSVTPTQVSSYPVNQGAGYCRHCGQRIAADSAFCEKCGERLE